jgi:hypothetical protein
MTMSLNWRTNSGVSGFHAAYQVHVGCKLSAQALHDELRRPVEDLNRTIGEERLSHALFWRHVVPLAADFGSATQLAEVVLTKLQGRSEAQTRIPLFAHHLHAIHMAYQKHRSAQTAPAIERMQQGWNFQGPGLLAAMANWTDEDLLVEEATVFVMPSLTGGGGGAHLPYNSVRIEAVGSDPADLAEVLRLTWLLSQLNLDLPRFAENVPVQRLDRVAALAMVPATLVAAESMQLASCTDDAIVSTARGFLPGEREETVTTLTQWWDVYKTTRPAWPLALQALDQLINP